MSQKLTAASFIEYTPWCGLNVQFIAFYSEVQLMIGHSTDHVSGWLTCLSYEGFVLASEGQGGTVHPMAAE